MARLHEYQGKAILAANGFKIPRGRAATTADQAVSSCGLSPAHARQLVESIRKLFGAALSVEARSLEINPLVLTKDGQFVAADCRITIDDYSVARHPELGIEIAREFDHPPTALERVAYAVEQNDHRGTFYFAQLATMAAKDSKGLVGFHGAGGGGSMMSMDAIVNAGFTIANFTDTSGNPSASKVYRASRIILAQPDLVGYFGSGSGVASQEQYWSAYGLAKAFWELDLDIPAVIRLGGNTEDRAVDILHRMSGLLRAPVEGYRKTDAPAMIAARFAELVEGGRGTKWKPRAPRVPKFVKDPSAIMLPVKSGRVWIDAAEWPQIRRAVETHSGRLIVDHAGAPVAALASEEFATRDSELLACDVECRLAGVEGFYLELDIPGLDGLIVGAR